MRISDWSSDVCSSDLRSPQRIFGNLQIRMWLAAARLHQRRRNEGLSRAPSSRLRRSVRRPGSRLIRRQSSFPSLNQDSDMTALAEITDALHKRSEEHTSELHSLMRISYAVFCLKKKQTNTY